MSPEEQEQFKAILKQNRFQRRDCPGRGPALTQGLFRCAICGQSLVVSYPKNTYSYGCGWKLLKYAETPCTRFIGYEFDQYIFASGVQSTRDPASGHAEIGVGGLAQSRASTAFLD